MSKRLYTPDLAERCKGEKCYRPSNGSEGEMFMEMWCGHCTKDEEWGGKKGTTCDIIAATMCFDTDDADYPAEWTYDAKGQPCCTAFEERAKP